MAEPGATWTWAGVLRRKSRAVSSLKMPESFAVTQEHAMHDSNTKVVVITGASAGVGRATAVAFARTGARVALLARGIEGLRGAAQEVENAGGKALTIPTDVADPRQVDAAAEQIEQQLGSGIHLTWIRHIGGYGQ